jgi:transaldolase
MEVTTNPSLAAKIDKPYHDVIKEILGILDKGSVLNIRGSSYRHRRNDRGRKKASKLDKRIVVKIPCTEDGLKACQALSKEGVSVNMTLIFSATQALLAAKAGAVFASAFVGRLEDKEPGSGLELVSDMVTIYDNYNFDTAVLFASVRSVEHVSLAALLGVDIITVPY